ncbi:MAG TPA: VacB/RNase II family 3'-5' exoribonuclease, partial [Chromatiales bacterium]|nr:VacB/RNase II family 3'-5' exoribonuclease [Chromatiales bacterium]
REARERGNSVYFPEHVVPMLPEVLSNGLCSLNPEVDRLCMVCEMHISKTGRLESFRFHEGLMRSHARLTYDEMAEIVVDRKIEARKRRGDLVVHLDRLYELYKVLHKARQRRGAIDFETVETRIEFNDQRKIERIVPVIRNDAHRLIEECMILANVAAARFLEKKKICTLYRIHEGPAEDRLEDVRTFLAELGLSLGGGDSPTAKDYARLLKQVQGRPDAQLIQTVLLRSLKQAVYSPDNKGHFGLSLKAYTHFTSPIRRYPDLLVHRAIRHLLRGGKPEEFRYGHADMEVLGDHCSQTERRADEATRDVMDWLKTEYMQDKLGEEFDGIITSVTSFGLFVQLTDIYVEGLVHVTSLKSDYYRFDPVGHRLIGENSGRVYRLGDPIRVLVARVDLEEKKIDFQPVEPEDEAERTPARKSRRGGKGRGKGKGGGKPGSKSAASGKRKGKKKGK